MCLCYTYNIHIPFLLILYLYNAFSSILLYRRNRVNNLGAISFLVLCQELHELELANNPVAQMNGYRDYVKKNIPDLCLLDGMSFDDGSQPTSGLSETISSSDYSASVETTSCSEKKSLTHEDQLVSSNDIVCVDQNVIRPSSCGGLEPKNFVVRKSIDRPSTAGKIRTLACTLEMVK